MCECEKCVYGVALFVVYATQRLVLIFWGEEGGGGVERTIITFSVYIVRSMEYMLVEVKKPCLPGVGPLSCRFSQNGHRMVTAVLRLAQQAHNYTQNQSGNGAPTKLPTCLPYLPRYLRYYHVLQVCKVGFVPKDLVRCTHGRGPSIRLHLTTGSAAGGGGGGGERVSE
jgi:hypothetical protein